MTEFKNFDDIKVCDNCKAASFSKIVHKDDCPNNNNPCGNPDCPHCEANERNKQCLKNS